MKTLPILVAKVLPLASLMWTISNDPKCLSLAVNYPTLPLLLPDVTNTNYPRSNLMWSVTL